MGSILGRGIVCVKVGGFGKVRGRGGVRVFGGRGKVCFVLGF